MPYEVGDGIKPREVTQEQVLSLSKKVKFVDMQFVNLAGRLQHFTTPSYMITESSLSKGFAKVDGSSIRGFTEINESDLVFVPDPGTFSFIPWNQNYARLLGRIMYRESSERLPTDTRGVAEGVEAMLKERGMTAFFGPEVEFFVFDKVEWDASNGNSQRYSVYSAESPISDEALRMREKEGYYPASPIDRLAQFRDLVTEWLLSFGIVPEVHHHEVSPYGQVEINFLRDTLVGSADSVVTLKYVARNAAFSLGKHVTFMPKPIFGDNGSGMHVHVSLWEGSGYDAKRNIFYDKDDEYAELSQEGRYFIGGLLEHSRSLAAIVAPTTNSYKRLVPGYEAPIYIAWSRGNRSANVRVPVYRKGSEAEKRVEFRTPDPSTNPYLALSAILLAGLDGIAKKIDPGDPVDADIYKLSQEEVRRLGIRKLPTGLLEAVQELLSDNDYLKPFFNNELIEKFTDAQLKEFYEVNARPHPYEFKLYFDS